MTSQLKLNEGLARVYREALQHEGHLVAVKMLKKSEIETVGMVRHPSPRNTFCQLVAQTHYLGRKLLIGSDDQTCYAFPSFFGLGELPKEAWKRYVGWQVRTEEAGRKAFEALPKFPMGTYDAVFLSTLEGCPVVPDVVIFFGNASQMLCIVAGYIASRGGLLAAEFNGFGTCAALIVPPMQKGRPTVVIPGNPARLLALPDKELGCGIPGNMLEELIENMQFMKAGGGSSYPPTWQIIQWQVQPPIGDLLKPDGSPSWIRR